MCVSGCACVCVCVCVCTNEITLRRHHVCIRDHGNVDVVVSLELRGGDDDLCRLAVGGAGDGVVH